MRRPGRVPELGEAEVLEGFDAAGKPRLRTAKRAITLRHLLTHTAGFTYEIWNADIARTEGHGRAGHHQLPEQALTTPLLFDPGERWEYGINIDWAGKMVEAVSGQKLGQYMQDNILGPLGMEDTGFIITTAARAPRHDAPSRRGRLTDARSRPRAPAAAGVRHGRRRPLRHGRRLPDVRAHDPERRPSDSGEAVLKPETVARDGEERDGRLQVGLLKTAAPPLSNDAEFFPGIEKQWGLTS